MQRVWQYFGKTYGSVHSQGNDNKQPYQKAVKKCPNRCKKIARPSTTGRNLVKDINPFGFYSHGWIMIPQQIIYLQRLSLADR